MPDQVAKGNSNYAITIRDEDTEHELSTKINVFDDDPKVVRNQILKGVDLLLADLGVDPYGYKKQGITPGGRGPAGSGS